MKNRKEKVCYGKGSYDRIKKTKPMLEKRILNI